MKKGVVSLLLAVALALGLTACGETGEVLPTPSPTVRVTPAPVAAAFALPRTGGSIHPILSRDRVNLTLGALVFEGLFTLDGGFTPQSVLCQSQTVSEDGLTWTFALRPGVTFSDGSPLTAAEVVDSLTLARKEESRYAGRMVDIKTVKGVEGDVVVTLASPNGALPALLDIPIVKGPEEAPLGTGPYVPQEEFLVARSDWWQGKSLPIQQIPLRTLPGAEDLISAFDTGDISMVAVDFAATNALGYGGNYETWDYPTTGMLFVGFHTTKGPCQDPALRRALARGFDRATVAVALYAGHAQPAELPISPASPLYDETAAAALAYAPQELERQLAALGYEKAEDGSLIKGRKPLALTLVVSTDNSFRVQTADYLAEGLRKAGVAVEVKKLAWSDYEKALKAGDFDLYLGETILTADFDPSALLAAGGALNYGKYANKETAELLAAFLAASGAERTAAASALYTRLGQEAPFATLAFKNHSVLTRWGMVAGLAPTQQNPFYGIEQWDIR